MSSPRFVANDELVVAAGFRWWEQGEPGEFLARLWALFGPPHEEYFLYELRDTRTGMKFTAGVISGGPSYGVAPQDEARADAVLDDFDALLASVTPVECSVELWPGEVIGFEGGTAYERITDPRAVD